MDITHDNVCSSMLSCFYSHLLSTGRPISSWYMAERLFIIHIPLSGSGDSVACQGRVVASLPLLCTECFAQP